MARHKGQAMYPKKTVAGSYVVTREARAILRAAARRAGKSESDVIEFCVRRSSAGLTKDLATAIAQGGGKEGEAMV